MSGWELVLAYVLLVVAAIIFVSAFRGGLVWFLQHSYLLISVHWSLTMRLFVSLV